MLDTFVFSLRSVCLNCVYCTHLTASWCLILDLDLTAVDSLPHSVCSRLIKCNYTGGGIYQEFRCQTVKCQKKKKNCQSLDLRVFTHTHTHTDIWGLLFFFFNKTNCFAQEKHDSSAHILSLSLFSLASLFPSHFYGVLCPHFLLLNLSLFHLSVSLSLSLSLSRRCRCRTCEKRSDSVRRSSCRSSEWWRTWAASSVLNARSLAYLTYTVMQTFFRLSLYIQKHSNTIPTRLII